MKEQKHIDRLFQEKFKDFEVSPSNTVWDNIKKELKKEDKKPALIIPLWYKIGGAAALLALLFWLGKPVLTSVSQSPQVVNTTDNAIQQDTTPEAVDNTTLSNIQTPLQTQENTKKPQTSFIKPNTKSTTVASTPLKQVPNTIIFNTKNKTNINTIQSVTTFIAKDITRDNTRFQQPISNDFSSLESLISSTNTNILSEKENKETTKVADPFLNPTDITEDAVLDTNTTYSKWEVGPYASPIYYDGFGDGSTVDERFADNNTENNLSLAYGLNVSYAVSNRLKIRSGVTKVTHSFNTNGVSFGATATPVALRNISQSSTNGLFVNIIDTPATQPNATPLQEFEGRNASTFYNGAINQTLGYIEVPLELEYALINKRIGVSVIGGASTLFLNENTISVEANGVRSEIGEANNINNVSYSTNIGLGLNYKITKSFNFNLEPTFKYQINTFSDSNNFNPYYLGVYTGFSLKF